MVWHGKRKDPLGNYRERLLRETAEYLHYHLTHPELTVEIPTIEVGSGSFPAYMAEHFWRHVLFED